MKDLISVIIPVYKVEQYLDECINSVVNQSYKNLEIILVDDGSPDKCPKMCDGWAKRDNRIKVVHKQNGGLSSARNAGLDVANGDYFAFVDSDDVVTTKYLGDMLQYADYDLVVSGYDCDKYISTSGGGENYSLQYLSRHM